MTILNSTPEELANSRHSIQALRHVVRSAYSPLQGVTGLSPEDQRSRLEEGLKRCDAVREALELAIKVVDLRTEKAGTPKAAAKRDLQAVPDLPESVTGFKKADLLAAFAVEEEWGVTAKRGVAARHKLLTLTFEDPDSSARIECSYDTKAGVFQGGTYTRANGSQVKVRAAQQVRDILAGVRTAQQVKD